jgi:tetratricopeptide (TPR) repeat protein
LIEDMLVPFIIIVGVVAAGLIILSYFVFFATRRISALSALLKAGKTKQVIRLAKRILARDSRSSDAHYLLGLAFLQEGKLELGLMEFKAVNQLGDFSGVCQEIPFRKQIAELFWRFNQKEEALKEYLLLTKSDPTDAESFYKVGLLFDERDGADRSLGYYAKAILIDPGHAKAHFQLGVVFYRQKKLADARRELETSLRIDGSNAEAAYYLGRLLKDGHDYAAALTALEKAQKDPELRQKVLVERGACFMSMNNFERAIFELERSVKLSTNDQDSVTLYGRYFLALCYEKSRDVEKAIGEWEKIYAKRPAFRDVAEKLSQYQELRADDSVKDYLTAGKEEFSKICVRASQVLGTEVQTAAEIPGGGIQIAGYEVDQRRLGTRKMPRLIRFYRTTDAIDDTVVRGTLEEMKKNNVIRGAIVCSSVFTRKALEFAENRPIDLYDREKLQDVLKNA